MAYKDQRNLASDDELKRRVQVAMCSAAIPIQAEAPATPNHTNRANYAKLVLNSPDSYMPLFALANSALGPGPHPRLVGRDDSNERQRRLERFSRHSLICAMV